MAIDLLSLGASLLPKLIGAAGPVNLPPNELMNGHNTFDTSNWSVATSGSKANASAIPQVNPYVVGGVALGGMVLWAVMKKKKG